ncbi:hypothetical protein V1511DRAFT_459088 [Dipodascopsis uninucleata]
MAGIVKKEWPPDNPAESNGSKDFKSASSSSSDAKLTEPSTIVPSEEETENNTEEIVDLNSPSVRARLACTKSRDIEHYVSEESSLSQEPTMTTPPYYINTDKMNTESASASLVLTSLEDAVGEEKTYALKKEAKSMQEGLAAILERILKVKGEYERLEGENKFLQDYIGNLMSASKMLSGRSTE